MVVYRKSYQLNILIIDDHFHQANYLYQNESLHPLKSK
jgi:hypothetical protein